MHGVCAACLKPCCKPEYCHNAVESWFLRQVSRHVHGKWWPQDWEHSRTCIAMTDRGCLLRAGRPVLCRSFVCPDYAAAYRDVWEVLYYSFLSDLMWEVGQLSSRVHLDCLPAERAPRYAKQLAARIAEGRRLMARAAGLMAPALGEPARHRIALELLAAMPRFFRASTRQAVLDRLTGGRNGTD
jgi:hypothetical protein